MKESKKAVKKMLADVDEDGSGEIDFPEFLEMMTLKMFTLEDELVSKYQ